MAESNYMSNEELKELLEAWDADENIPATPQYQQPSEDRLAAIDENPQLMTDDEYDWMIQDLERAFAHVPQTVPLLSDAWYNSSVAAFPQTEHTPAITHESEENMSAPYHQPSEERLAELHENPQIMTDNEYDWMIQDLERAFAHVPQTVPLPSDVWYNSSVAALPQMVHSSAVAWEVVGNTAAPYQQPSEERLAELHENP